MFKISYHLYYYVFYDLDKMPEKQIYPSSTIQIVCWSYLNLIQFHTFIYLLLFTNELVFFNKMWPIELIIQLKNNCSLLDSKTKFRSLFIWVQENACKLYTGFMIAQGRKYIQGKKNRFWLNINQPISLLVYSYLSRAKHASYRMVL